MKKWYLLLVRMVLLLFRWGLLRAKKLERIPYQIHNLTQEERYLLTTLEGGVDWLSEYDYRKTVIINSATDAGENYQMMLRAVSNNDYYDYVSSDTIAFSTVQFTMSDIDSNGNIYSGATDGKIYKSTDGGDNFSLVYTFSNTTEKGIWMVYIDSNDYIYVGPQDTVGNRKVYRSIDGGDSFSEVLDFGNTDSLGWHMTEDQNGYLYIGEYSRGDGTERVAIVWKSTDSGVNFSNIQSWDARHIHDIEFNSYNNWIYVTVGESGTESEKVWRTKDGGSNWQEVVTGQKFVPIEFIDDWVYLGTDFQTAGTPNYIKRFQDDGTSEPFVPSTVYTTDSDHSGPFVSASCKLVNDLIFSTSSSFVLNSKKHLIIQSGDGAYGTWNVVEDIQEDWAYVDLTNHPTRNNVNKVFAGRSSSVNIDICIGGPYEISLEDHAKSDFGDVRITKSDGTTIMAGDSNGWMQEKTDDDYANIWFKHPDNLSSGTHTIYVYYGKDDATWSDNFDNTFIDGDEGDFSDGWTDYDAGNGLTSASGGIITSDMTSPTANKRAAQKSTTGITNAVNCAIESRCRCETDNANSVTGPWIEFYKGANDRISGLQYAKGANEGKIYAGGLGSGVVGFQFGSVNHPRQIWYRAKLFFISDSQIFKFYSDNDVFLESVSSGVTMAGGTYYLCFSTTKRFWEAVVDATVHNKVNWDWLFVRKYVDPEPTFGAKGAEESGGQSSLILGGKVIIAT